MKQIKGGSWINYNRGTRSANHDRFFPDYADYYLSFRLIAKRRSR